MTSPPLYRHPALRAAIIIAASAALAIEWSHAPNATILLGPFYLAWYSRDAATYAFATVLWFALLAPAFRPCVITACVFAVSVPFWLILGLIGQGIAC
jgi:hypothetical protein